MGDLISAVLTTFFPRTILKLEREEYEKGFKTGWRDAAEMYNTDKDQR